LLCEHGHYNDFIPAWFGGDVKAWESFKGELEDADKKNSAFIEYIKSLEYSIRDNKGKDLMLVFPDGKKARATEEEIKRLEEKANEYIEMLLTQLRPYFKTAKK
jgi:hypothetical protein